MKTVGTGVTGKYVTFGSIPVVFALTRRTVGPGVADRFVTFGNMLVEFSAPGDVFPLDASTTPGSKRIMMQTTTVINCNMVVVSRTFCMKKTLLQLIRNIVMIALKYGCFHSSADEGKNRVDFILALYRAEGYADIVGSF
jgi:hypothetical protein